MKVFVTLDIIKKVCITVILYNSKEYNGQVFVGINFSYYVIVYILCNDTSL